VQPPVNEDKKYIVQRPGKADQEFPSSTAAIRYIVGNKGRAWLLADGELILSKGCVEPGEKGFLARLAG